MRSRYLRGINGRRLADHLRRINLTLVHIHGPCYFIRARPHGRLVVVPLYPGETLPVFVVRSILLHAAVSEQDAYELIYE